MRGKVFLSFLLLSTYVGFSQGEANIWYFGNQAGLNFNSGSPIAITDGQLNTREGCAVLSNNLGQLLFYTDGVTVYNKHHQIMVNGTDLLGHSSSAQSATIVPKPGSGNLYYIFTTTNEHNPDGFRYSIVDLTLDGGNGAVTAEKNVLIFTPSIENISITKHANGIDYWIISHEWDSNNFRVYLLSSAGLNSTPNIISVGLPVTGLGFQAGGITKISPSGTKLAMTSSSDFLILFDFSNATGIISNPIILSEEAGELYGAEFSPNENVLYVTNLYPHKLYQYDLTASDIPNSKITLVTGAHRVGQLQLGPDGRIYLTVENKNYISVINNPDTVGVGCDLQLDTISLNGKTARLGLPSFSQSFFFTPAIQFQNACTGENTTFSFTTNQSIISTSWNFGDGITSTELSPTHSYASAGTYTVSVTTVSSWGIGTSTRDLLISDIPTATQPDEIKVCDTDNDGFASFDLTQQNNVILNGQSASQYQIKYFASADDYAADAPIVNPTSYTNSVAFGLQSIIAEVSNLTNSNCKTETNFTIQVFKTATAPSATIQAIRVCDNNSYGTDMDGKVVLDLTQNEPSILNGQSLADFSVSYFTDSNFINQINTPTNYVNSTTIETIYVKVKTLANENCFVTTSFVIAVSSLPTVNPAVTLKQCDDDNDGFSAFNLTEANQLLVASTSGLIFSYFETAIDAQNNVDAIANSTAYTNQFVSNTVVYARIQNANDCFRVVPLNLMVSTTLVPSTFQRTFISCDTAASGSNTDGISTFDFSSVTNEIQALYPTGQLLNISYYKNLADALAEINAITNISSYSNVSYPNIQNIYVRVDSQLNNECLGLGHHITLTVEPVPIIQPQIIRHCDDDHDGFYSFDTSSLENMLLNGLTNVSIVYSDSNGMDLPSPLPNPFVSQSQIINVMITNNTTQACANSSTIEFVVDALPEAFPIPTSVTTVCDDELDPLLQNGLYAFDTSAFQSTILGNQTGMLVNYFDENGNSLPSPLPNPFITNTQNILVEVINRSNNSCKATLIIPFKVNSLPLITLTDIELICRDNLTFTKVIDAGLLNPTTSSNFTYQWYLNGAIITGATTYNFTINTAGVYTVDVTNNNSCSLTRTITVTASNSAIIDNIEVTDFSDNNTIQVFASGLGDYVYSLNDIHYQASPIFRNIPVGIYILYIKDLKGCDLKTETVYVMGVPKYFTPNDDGYNDFWTIKSLDPESIIKINIFDRYGKLLKQFNPKLEGWDGKFRGQMLPATDYWYSIEFDNGKFVKGHFSLLR